MATPTVVTISRLFGSGGARIGREVACRLEMIRAMAEVGDAVIVGRGASHVLGDRSNVIRVFLHAPIETRVRLAIEEHSLADESVATALVRKIDEQRAEFVRKITGRNWRTPGYQTNVTAAASSDTAT